MLTTTIRARLNEKQGAENDHVENSPWVALDRFIREMESSRHGPDRSSTALATICESTNARLAFIYTEGIHLATEMVGARPHRRGGAGN